MVRKELKKLRVDYDLTQKKLSELLGLSIGAYNLIEMGKRRGSPSTWAKIQELFKIPDEQMWTIQNPKQ